MRAGRAVSSVGSNAKMLGCGGGACERMTILQRLWPDRSVCNVSEPQSRVRAVRGRTGDKHRFWSARCHEGGGEVYGRVCSVRGGGGKGDGAEEREAQPGGDDPEVWGLSGGAVNEYEIDASSRVWLVSSRV